MLVNIYGKYKTWYYKITETQAENVNEIFFFHPLIVNAK